MLYSTTDAILLHAPDESVSLLIKALKPRITEAAFGTLSTALAKLNGDDSDGDGDGDGKEDETALDSSVIQDLREIGLKPKVVVASSS